MNLNELTSKADGGDPQAQLDLGKAYYVGEEIPLDLEKAEFYLQKASSMNLIEADFFLALILGDESGHNKPDEAFPRLLDLAQRGLAKARCEVGEYYLNGWGTVQDYKKAFEWFQRSSDQGYYRSHYYLGWCYYCGLGISTNLKKAAELFKKGADLDDVEAQAMLGSCYVEGVGVAKDNKLALHWTQKAVDRGHPVAQFNLAHMYAGGAGVELNLQKAAELFEKSAEHGLPEAQLRMGYYHLFGWHVSPDGGKALRWFKASADQGNDEAKNCAEHMEKTINILKDQHAIIDNLYEPIVKLLLQIPRVEADSPEMWGWLVKAKTPSKKEANKFFLACILNFQMRAEYIWGDTKKVVEEKWGDPDDLWGYVYAHGFNQWMDKKKEYSLHMLKAAHERVWKIGKSLVKSYGSDARAIWEGQEPAEVTQRLYDLGEGKYGVGENIAAMIVGALIDTGQIHGVGDVKADTQVRKVVGRVFRGHGYSKGESKDCTLFARKLYPPNPWLLDQPLYFLGKETCRDNDPDCQNCFLRLQCVHFKKHHHS